MRTCNYCTSTSVSCHYDVVGQRSFSPSLQKTLNKLKWQINLKLNYNNDNHNHNQPYLRSHLTAKLTNLWPSFPDRTGIWSVGFVEGGKQENWRKTLRAGKRTNQYDNYRYISYSTIVIWIALMQKKINLKIACPSGKQCIECIRGNKTTKFTTSGLWDMLPSANGPGKLSEPSKYLSKILCIHVVILLLRWLKTVSSTYIGWVVITTL